MIRIGLILFKEYDKLIGKKNNILYEYVGFLFLVELDIVYYGIFWKFFVENWINEVFEFFCFVVKVY